MKKLSIIFFALIMALGLYSCQSDQSKAETEVKELIKKFSAYPDSYEPIEFMPLEETTSNAYSTHYKLNHIYRIKTSQGIQQVLIHDFVISKTNKSGKIFVEIQPFEKWE